MHEFAPAKVNLYLHVTGRRADGYHLLDSLAVFPPVGDTLSATLAPELSLRLEGRFGAGLASEPDNLVLRAARALAAAAGITTGAKLVLTKELPIASGIGGGSADAAASLRLLSRLWGLDVDLHAIATRLGADVPVCLANVPTRMAGIGEILTPAPDLPQAGILLANPGIAVATPAVFKARTSPYSPPATVPAAWDSTAALVRDLAALGNDLEAPAIALAPEIADVLAALQALPGARLARMSGSGATCFALFDAPAAADAAARAMMPTKWWVWGGALTLAATRRPD